MKPNSMKPVAVLAFIVATGYAFQHSDVTCAQTVDEVTAKVTSSIVRGERILSRSDLMDVPANRGTVYLPNPKVPERLIMLYGAVPAANRNTAAVGKPGRTRPIPYLASG